VRAALLVILALATGLLVAACGSSGDETKSVGGAVVTVPTDVHGIYPELETLLAQFPYQRWYTDCVLARAKKELSPKEAEALNQQSPESNGVAKAEEIIAAAGVACRKSSKRPLVDPNASEKELALFRAGFVEPYRSQAEEHGFEGVQLECIEETVEKLPRGKIIGLGNGTSAVREGILLSVLAQCVKAE
jgi:hypothetical protein